MPATMGDRYVSIDRAIAAYRRFVGCEFDEVVPCMIADLLHWHRNCEGTLTEERASDIVIEALEVWKREMDDINAMRGNRRRNRQGDLVVHDETISSPAFWDEPVPGPIDNSWARIRDSVLANEAAIAAERMADPNSNSVDAFSHPGWQADMCNCPECADLRAEERGFARRGGRWLPADAVRTLEDRVRLLREEYDEPTIDF